MRIAAGALVVASALLTLLAGCQKSEHAAVVNGEVISEADVARELGRVRAEFESSGQTLDEERAATIREQILDRMIEMTLLHQESRNQGLQATDQELEEELQGVRSRFADDQGYRDALKQLELTEKDLRDQLQKDLAVRKLLEAKVNEITVSDQEIRSYFEDNPALFQQPAQIRASHILIRMEPGADAAARTEAMRKIGEVKSRLRGGADFADTARELSEGPSAPNGGDLGYFGPGQMVPPFEEAAFDLKVGQVSDVVETQFGLHIIKLTGRRPAKNLAFEDVRDNIAKLIRRERSEQIVTNYVEQLKSAASIERPDSGR